jgi:hypothetical protein
MITVRMTRKNWSRETADFHQVKKIVCKTYYLFHFIPFWYVRIIFPLEEFVK